MEDCGRETLGSIEYAITISSSTLKASSNSSFFLYKIDKTNILYV